MNFQSLLDASKNVDINKAFEDADKKQTRKEDPRVFKLNKKDGVGKATIRFLPHPDGKIPFVKRLEHFFEWEKKFFVGFNRRTLPNEKDPTSQFAYKVWDRFNDTGDTYWQNLGRLLKPREKMLSLVYVIKDPFAEEGHSQEGEVKIFSYGPEIYGKLVDAPKTENDFGPIPHSKIVSPFSIAEDGANFGLILKKEDPVNKPKEFPNYKSSEFLDKCALFDGDKAALQNMLDMNKDNFHDIYKEIAPENFDSYEEIEKKLIGVFGDLYLDIMGDDVRVAKSTAKETAQNSERQKEANKDFELDDEIPEFPTTRKSTNQKGEEMDVQDSGWKDNKETNESSDDSELDDLSAFFNS